jgi:hypothetical protein
MPKKYPRSPYERLAGYVHLPRLIDKARLHRQGQLVGYNYKTLGFDKHLLAFLHLDPETFENIANELDSDDAIADWVRQNGVQHSPEQIEEWNRHMIGRHPDTPEKLARFKFFLKESGGEKRPEVKTYFDLIELDEGRM